MKTLSICFSLFLGILGLTPSFAQVGFNNPNPDPSSILDLTASDKGLLIPRMTTAQRQAIGAPAQSLLVYDTNLNGFFFYQGGNWYSLNEWVKVAGSNTVSLSGNASVTGDVSAATMNMTNLAASNNISTSSLNAGSASVSGTISAGSFSGGSVSGSSVSSSGSLSGASLSVSGFSTNALVPTGVIVMWSGNPAAVPAGWRLCDGGGGTPDLRGRFVVGYNPFDVDYNFVGKLGGEKRHTLTTTELPSHTHPIPGSNVGGFGGFGAVPGVNPGVNEGGGNTSATGGNTAHENRPPFYTIAYIMKL